MMSLFGQPERRGDEEILASSDVATRALSVTVVENDFVEGVYERLANVYDLAFGPVLNPGRLRALERMTLQPGQSVLEVGVGTGINATLYPRDCAVVGIDLSAPMLEKARQRCARHNARHVRLLAMDAAALTFPDASFDVVYAPYLISVVPDPVKVAAEMRRVCRRGGRIVILNHFRSPSPVLSRLERAISPLTKYIGFKADLDLPAFLAQAGLAPISIEKVNVPRIWSLVTCINE
ncbi:MAG: methyltransferase domain-containing protein [Planctomycetes bacterium]|nr:methyltransferase domain-containing protein [Planctomycetota bacterium]